MLLCSAIHMSIFLPAGINNETKAPLFLIVQPLSNIFLLARAYFSAQRLRVAVNLPIYYLMPHVLLRLKKDGKNKTMVEILVAQKDASQYCILSCSLERGYLTL